MRPLLFPLPQGEGETTPPFLFLTTASDCQFLSKRQNVQRRPLLFPLPAGEGQGEGKPLYGWIGVTTR